jgi:hypothetical protein
VPSSTLAAAWLHQPLLLLLLLLLLLPLLLPRLLPQLPCWRALLLPLRGCAGVCAAR